MQKQKDSLAIHLILPKELDTVIGLYRKLTDSDFDSEIDEKKRVKRLQGLRKQEVVSMFEWVLKKMGQRTNFDFNAIFSKQSLMNKT